MSCAMESTSPLYPTPRTKYGQSVKSNLSLSSLSGVASPPSGEPDKISSQILNPTFALNTSVPSSGTVSARASTHDRLRRVARRERSCLGTSCRVLGDDFNKCLRGVLLPRACRRVCLTL